MDTNKRDIFIRLSAQIFVQCQSESQCVKWIYLFVLLSLSVSVCVT